MSKRLTVLTLSQSVKCRNGAFFINACELMFTDYTLLFHMHTKKRLKKLSVQSDSLCGLSLQK